MDQVNKIQADLSVLHDQSVAILAQMQELVAQHQALMVQHTAKMIELKTAQDAFEKESKDKLAAENAKLNPTA